MNASLERRLLQAAVAAACLVPLTMGTLSLWQGPAVLRGISDPVPADLDSHFRYLSGLLLAIGLGAATCVPAIERKGPRFRLLGAIVVAGALGRLLSLAVAGTPSAGHLGGLALELVLVPLLMLWQMRVARQCEPPRPLSRADEAALA